MPILHTTGQPISNWTAQTHPRMPMRDRAAQFAPFAALTGHRAALAETERRAADAAEPENEWFSEP